MKLLFPFAKRFIAGENLEDTSEQILSLQQQGFRVALNLVGESANTKEEALNAQAEYLKALKLFPMESLSLSIKPSLLNLNHSIKDCLKYLTPIVELAYSSQQKIRFDMENSATTDSTIEICLYLNQRFPNVMGLALQANLFRTVDDLKVLKSENISIRLVKGAYWDSEIKLAQELGIKNYPVFTRKSLTDLSWMVCSLKLFNYQKNIFPAFATHNAYSIAFIEEFGKDKIFEFQRIHGMADIIHNYFNKYSKSTLSPCPSSFEVIIY